MTFEKLREVLAVVVYALAMTFWFVAPIGGVIGYYLPRHMEGRRPRAAFWLGARVGTGAGAAVALILTLLTAWPSIRGTADWGSIKYDAERLLSGFVVCAVTMIPVCAVYVGLWVLRWTGSPSPQPTAGWLYYDDACPLCQRWVRRLGFIARQGGFELVPFQSDAARRDLGLAEGDLPPEMKLRLADGRLLGGVDAFIALAEAVGWCAPLGWLLRLPGVNALAWRGYRWIAANRYCLDGPCAVPPQPERKLP